MVSCGANEYVSFNEDYMLISKEENDEVYTSSDTLKVLGANGWLPFVTIVNDGEISDGVSYDVLNLIFESSKYKIDIEPMVKWEKMLNQLKFNEIDLVTAMYYKEERTENFWYSEPYTTEKTYLWVKKGHTFNFDKMSDLDGKVALIPRGGYYTEDLEKQKSKMTVKDIENKIQAIELLDEGLGDFFVSSYNNMYIFLKSIGRENDFVVIGNPLIENTIHFAMSNTNTNNEVKNFINQRIIELKENGEIEQLIKQSLGE